MVQNHLEYLYNMVVIFGGNIAIGRQFHRHGRRSLWGRAGSHRESEVNPDRFATALVDIPAGERSRIVSSVPAQRCFEQNRQLEFEAKI